MKSRLTIEYGKDTKAMLDSLEYKTGAKDHAEVITKAVQVLNYLYKEMEAGNQLYFRISEEAPDQ